MIFSGHRVTDAHASQDPMVTAEVAPSGRGKCKTCDEPIKEGTVRIRFKAFNGRSLGNYNAHPECAFAVATSPSTFCKTLFSDRAR